MASLDTVNGSVIPLEGSGAALRFRDQNVTFDLLRLSIESSDRDVFRKTILKSAAGRFGGSQCPRRGRLIADLFVLPDAPSLMTDPQLVDLLFNGSVATFHAFAVSERSWLDGQHRLIRTVTLEHTGLSIPFPIPISGPTAHCCVYLSPDSPYLVRLIESYDVTGCSLTLMLKTTAAWLTARDPYLVATPSAAYGRLNIAFLYEGGEWRLRLATRRMAGGSSYVTKWSVPESLFDGDWHSLGVTHNDGAGTATAWLDAVALTKVSGWTWHATIGGSTGLRLFVLTNASSGINGVATYSMHNVLVGNFKLWDRDLTAAQLLSEIGWGRMLDSSNSLCWHDYSEQAGSVAYDHDGAGPSHDLDLVLDNRWRLD